MIERFTERLFSILDSGVGWIISILMLMLSFVNPVWVSFATLLGAISIDLVFGIWSSLKQKKFILSGAIRETFKKTFIYAACLFFVFSMENTFPNDAFYITRVLGVIGCVCEFWSTLASMLIINPSMPFVKILRLQLKGEIEKKLGNNISNLFNDNNNG